MCGIFGGMSTYLSAHEIGSIRELGILSQMRGIDSTGLAVAYRKQGKQRYSYGTVKNTVDSTAFFQDKNVDKAITPAHNHSIAAIIGHCRAATLGDVTKENAHPFIVGKVVGVHNGTIDKLRPLDIEADKRTDSLALYELINKDGIEAALKFIHPNGAYALVWFDTEKHTLNMIRNGQRTLYYQETQSNSMYWASEMRMLDYINSGSSAIFKERPKLLDVNKLYTWEIGKPSQLKTEEIKLDTPVFQSTFRERVKGVKRGADLQTPWEEVEEVEEVREEIQQRVVPARVGPTVPLLTYRDKDKKKEDGINAEKDHRIIDARTIFPNRTKLDVFPETTNVQGTPCVLRYAGYRGVLYTPKEALRKLEKGCIITGVIPGIADDVYWCAPDEFITSKLKSDPFMRNTKERFDKGFLCYVSHQDQEKINELLLYSMYGMGQIVEDEVNFNSLH